MVDIWTLENFDAQTQREPLSKLTSTISSYQPFENGSAFFMNHKLTNKIIGNTTYFIGKERKLKIVNPSYFDPHSKLKTNENTGVAIDSLAFIHSLEEIGKYTNQLQGYLLKLTANSRLFKLANHTKMNGEHQENTSYALIEPKQIIQEAKKYLWDNHRHK